MKKAPRIYQASARHLVSGTDPEFPPGSLDDISTKWLSQLVAKGFDWFYLYGVWDSGTAGRAVSRAHPSMWAKQAKDLPHGSILDVCGSPFAIKEYRQDPRLGEPGALARLRERCQNAGLKLMLDFVVNHTALDHSWVTHRPEWFVQAQGEAADNRPEGFIPLPTMRGWRIFAHGKDPYFPSWADTLQLNLLHPDLIRAHTENLLQAAGQCDGLRADMAMLALSDIFRKTWGPLADPADGSPLAEEDFWTIAIDRLRSAYPNCLLCGEIYWSLEGQMLDMGFDLAYDKSAYDLMRHGDGRAFNAYETAVADRLPSLLRFSENHDEERMFAAYGKERAMAALPLVLLYDGPILVHDGQLQGSLINAGIHMARHAPEPMDGAVAKVVDLFCKVRPSFQQTIPVAVQQAWDGNPSHECLVTKGWQTDNKAYLMCVNFAEYPSQGRVRLPMDWIGPNGLEMIDLHGGQAYSRPRAEQLTEGLFVDLPPWGLHLFEIALET